MEKGYQVEFVGGVAYDFKDKTGKQVSGICQKALLSQWKDGLCIGLDIVKVCPDCKISIGDCGVVPLFDKYRRFAGFGG